MECLRRFLVPGFGLRALCPNPESDSLPVMSVALLAPFLALDFPLAVKAGTAQNSGQARRAAVKCHQFGEVPDEEWGPGKLEFGSAGDLVRMRSVIVPARGRRGLLHAVVCCAQIARDLGDETPLHWHCGAES